MLREKIERFYASKKTQFTVGDQSLIREFLERLDQGNVRAAYAIAGTWKVNSWVKKGILLAFRAGVMREYEGGGSFRFFDKDNLPLKNLQASDGVRLVPGGSAIRFGAFVASGVTCMPPMYINVGARVETQSMIDSHALVGSCAQVGKRVHISAGAQIGGVLEPIGATPVVIEDEALIGGQTGVFEGVVVRRQAVISAGVILTRSTPIYDLVQERILRSSKDQPLEVPEGAVVVPGSRTVDTDFARAQGLSIATPLIVKYRDAKTEHSIQLETALR